VVEVWVVAKRMVEVGSEREMGAMWVKDMRTQRRAGYESVVGLELTMMRALVVAVAGGGEGELDIFWDGRKMLVFY